MDTLIPMSNKDLRNYKSDKEEKERQVNELKRKSPFWSTAFLNQKNRFLSQKTFLTFLVQKTFSDTLIFWAVSLHKTSTMI